MKRPQIATGLIILYIVAVILLLISLDRTQVTFHLLNMIAFPLFVFTPFLIVSSPIDTRLKAVLILFVLAVAVPLVGLYDSSYLELIIQICIFTALALGLNIVVGFAGLLDLGYIAFFAVGAYVWAMFTSSSPTVFNINGMLVPGWTFYLFLPIAVLVAALTGILLGLPVLRLRGDYLAIVTLGFGEVIRILARNFDAFGNPPVNLTNGAQGLLDVGRPPLPDIILNTTGTIANTFNITIVTNLQPVAFQILLYIIGIAIVGVVILVAQRLDNSPIGRAWTAIREDEVAAIAMGIPLVRMKLLAFAAGASFAGAVGVLFGAKNTFVSPESFNLLQSISVIAMVIVGGMGSIKGAMFGAAIVTLLNLQVLKALSLQINSLKNIDYVVPIINFHIRDWPSQLEPAKYERLVFGILLVVMMIFRPAGLFPEARRRLELQRNEADLPDEGEISKNAEAIGRGDN